MMVGCEVCSASDKLFQCARCRRAFYCSKDHQVQHWKAHKSQCNVLVGKNSLQVNVEASTSSSAVETRQLVEQFAQKLSTDSAAALALGDDQSHWHQNHLVVLTASNDESARAKETVGTATMGLEDVKLPNRNANDDGRSAAAAASALTPLYPPPYLHRNARPGVEEQLGVNSPGWVQTMSQYVVRDLDSHGICVIDNFVGNNLGAAILAEVLDMYESGQFVDGKLMSNSSENMSRVIRGDKIHWVTGQEAHCRSIGHLVRLVDSVVLSSNRMANNGKLGQYIITDRTKAMVACYPGGGAAYVKHVDNPNKDGRCVTSIYYLNKNWDVKKDGGLLRIFPRDWPQVADIEPLFDRILFFWSDRRNPHEVQPALRTRYAITLWYQDKVEREQAALKH